MQRYHIQSVSVQSGKIGYRRLMRFVLPIVLLILSFALASGFSLERSPEFLLSAHIITGVGGIAPLGYFLYHHWWRRRQRVGKHHNAVFGYIATAALAGLLISGLALLVWTNWVWLQRIHSAAWVILMVDLSFHGTWRWRQKATKWRKPVRIAIPLIICAGLLLVANFGFSNIAKSSAPATQPVEVPLVHNAMVMAGFSHDDLPRASVCADCHVDIYQDWSESAHAHAVQDAYYQSLAAMFIQESGLEAVRYCAECHNPVGLVRGEIDWSAKIENSSDSGNAYEVRALGVDLAISSAAAEGVTCVICHLDTTQPVMDGRSVSTYAKLPENILASVALRAVPEQHQTDMTSSTLQQAELCRSCHNLSTPEGTLLEPTYEEWLASPYPAEGISCQDCHMPRVAGQKVNNSIVGHVNAHGGLPGAPSSLPDISANPDLLQQAAVLDVNWSPTDDGQLEISVAVTNKGAGHYLPTGADDLRQVWLEVSLLDDTGNLVWQTGALSGDDRLAPDAVQFRKVLGDAQGRPVQLHRFWIATQILEDTRIAPRETRTTTWQITDPGSGPYNLIARLLYRDVPPGFAEFAFEKSIDTWPAVEMAGETVSIP